MSKFNQSAVNRSSAEITAQRNVFPRISHQRMIRKFSKSIVSAFCLMMSSFSAFAAIDYGNAYFVAPNGSDENAGTESAPFATITKFFEVATPGKTLYARGGIYRGQEVHINKSGSAGAYIAVKNYPNEVPIFDGSNFSTATVGPALFYADDGSYVYGGGTNTHHIWIEGLVIRNYYRSGIHIGANYPDKTSGFKTVSDYVIKYNVVDNAGQNGIAIYYGDNCTVEYNMVSRTGWDYSAGSWSSNINFYNMYGTNNVVRGNISFHATDISNYHTDGNGFILDMYRGPTTGGAKVENNIFFENGGAGIAITRTDNVTIQDNTMYENGKEPSFLSVLGRGISFYKGDGDGTSQYANIHVKNNIVYQTSGNAVAKQPDFTEASKLNNWISGEQSGVPGFVDGNAKNFALTGSSVAKDTGTTGAAASSLWYDTSIIKAESSPNATWYRWAPNIDYIKQKGGLANTLRTIAKPVGAAPDKGAMEYTTTPPTSGADVTVVNITPTNLLNNSGFEVWNRNWTIANSSVFGVQTSSPERYAGNGALKVTGTTSWTAAYQTVNVAPNTNYTYSYYLKGNSLLGMKAITTGWTDIVADYIVPTNTWTRYQQTFNSGANTTILIAVYDGGNGTNYVDNVSLVASGSSNSSSSSSSSSSPSQSAYNGPHNIPGKTEAEDFNIGGAGVAYSDGDSTNNGGQYRSEQVDIATTGDAGNGYTVGWLGDGEWLNYSMTTIAAGTYDIEIRVASAIASPGSLNVSLDGVSLGSVSASNTGNWDTYQTKVISGVTLAAGSYKTLKLAVVGGGFNVNWINFKSQASSSSSSAASSSSSVASSSSSAASTGSSIVKNFESDTVGTAYRVAGWDGDTQYSATATVVGAISGVPANGSSTKAVKVVTRNWNAGSKYTFTIPAGKTLANYVIKFDTFLPKNLAGFTGGSENLNKSIIILAAPTITTAFSNSQPGYLGAFSTNTQGSNGNTDVWFTHTFTPNSVAASIGGTFELGIALDRSPQNNTSNDFYLLDNITLQPKP